MVMGKNVLCNSQSVKARKAFFMVFWKK